MEIIDEAIKKMKNFGTSYSIVFFTVNPFFHSWQPLGFYSFNEETSRGYGFTFFFVGVNLSRNPYKRR